MKVALALGGGGVRGLAHIGVLKILEKEGIGINLIAGTSMGAIIGGAYALRPDAAWLEEKALGLLGRKELFAMEAFTSESKPEKKIVLLRKIASFFKELCLWNVRVVKKWLVEADKIEPLISELVGEKRFEETKIPVIVQPRRPKDTKKRTVW